MQKEALKSLIADIQKQKTEQQTVELKETHGGFPKRIYDTISSFSNQDSGGIIIFGMSDKPNYEIVGVYDAEDTQKKIMELCGQMEPNVRAVVTICDIDGKTVVAAEIPGVEISERPVFYRGRGKLKGSYVRIGDADIPMTPYEIYRFEAFRKRICDDLRLVEHAKIRLLNQEMLHACLTAAKKERRNLAENVSDADILEMLGVTVDGTPTLAGVMAFSDYPQAYFPQLCVTAIVVPGTEIGDQGTDGERFIDNKRITGNISEMLAESVEFVRRNSRTKTIVGEDGARHDKTEYPMAAVREAVLNALVHRDYSRYTESVPVSIEMYRDRMEIKSSGGLFGTASVELLGRMRTETRNVALVNILGFLNVTENRYSGIPTMRKACSEAKLPMPEFVDRHGEFNVTFRNNIFEQKGKLDKSDMRKAVLEFCSIPRSRNEMIEFTGLSRYYTMSAIVQPLIDQGLLAQTMPDKPKSPKQKYVKSNGMG